MTLAELNALWLEKIREENPLRLPDAPAAETAEDVEVEFLEQCKAEDNYDTLFADALEEVYRALQEELGMSRDEIEALPPTTKLPPHTNELAEKLRSFPSEFAERSTE